METERKNSNKILSLERDYKKIIMKQEPKLKFCKTG